MSQQELLRQVVQTLDRLQIQCMLTGSLASSLQGEPRATHDVDLLVDLKSHDVTALLNAFNSPDLYLSQSAVNDAVRNRRMFNLLETTTGAKIDFWLLTSEPFDQSRFQRKRPLNVEGLVVDVSSPEDTILMKLKWAKASGGSEKQFGDAVSVFEVQSGRLDLTYIQHWVRELDVTELWQRLVDEAEPISVPTPSALGPQP